MKLALVSHWYDPEGGAAAGPGTAARVLRDRGHDVHVLTGFPHYPADRVHEGYHIRPYQRELMDGVTVHRVPLYPSHDTRALPRAASYLSLAASGAAAAAFALKGARATLVYSSPATTAIPAMALRALRGTPYAVWIQDMWPQSVTSSGFLANAAEGRVERTLHRYCDAVYRHAANVSVISPGMRDLVADRGVVSRDAIDVVPNWADEHSFYPTTPSAEIRRDLGSGRRFTAMYAGNFGEMQSLDTVIHAANQLRDLQDVEIVLVGGGVMERQLREQVSAEGLSNVRFVGGQPFSRMAQVLSMGDVQLISLKDVPLLRSTMPSKIQANLACAKPLIGAVAGDAAHVIRESGAGLTVAPGDPDALAAAIRKMAAMTPRELAGYGEAARRHYDHAFSESVVGDQLSDMLTSIARTA